MDKGGFGGGQMPESICLFWFNMNVSREQQSAIEHKNGPALILAGPGSGKTTVITQRIQYLIKQCHIPPSQLLVITFTKAAAEEMRERFLKLCPLEGTKVRFGTFHSVFFMIIKHAYGYSGNDIIHDDKKRQILKDIFNSIKLEVNDEQEFLSLLESEISLVKGEMISLQHYHAKCCGDDEFQLFFHGYQERLMQLRMLDFDDMLVYCYELLKERKDILALWQRQFSYILIDEFQDINRIQYNTIRLLAGKSAHLFAVGDDDQSIYRFRGAKPEIMLNFEKDYPQAKRMILNKNYRCTDKIVKAAERVIANNKKRFPKNMQAVRSSTKAVMVRLFHSAETENEYIIEQIRFYQEQGLHFSEIAVLFRTNTQPRTLVSKLMEVNIPFIMRDMIPNIFNHWIAKNLIAYIRLALELKESGTMERGLFLQVMNRPLRYISREALEKAVSFSALKRYYQQKAWMLERIERLEQELTALAAMQPMEAVAFLRKEMEYEKYLKQYAEERRISKEELLEILDEIQESAKAYETYQTWFAFMEQYEEELKQQFLGRKKSSNGVCLSTMHSAKGLEYKAVFIIDANEGIMPHHKSVLDADLEEERRLFYVAMTRAKNELHICAVKERYHKEMKISRFVEEVMLPQSRSLSSSS